MGSDRLRSRLRHAAAVAFRAVGPQGLRQRQADLIAPPPRSVLQVVSSTKRRGAEIHALDLDRALSALGRDVQTVALTPAEGTTVDLPTLGERSLAPSTLLKLRRMTRDVEHVISHGSRALPACWAAQEFSRRRFVFRSIGDAVFWARSPVRRARVTLYLHKAEAVVALWPRSADSLVERYRVPRPRITVIPTGVPADRFPAVDPARRAAARTALGLGDERPIVLYLGWLSPEKGPQVAIEALAKVPDALLVVAGDGPQRAELERLAASMAPDRVRFLGAVDDVSKVMSASDVFVLPASIEGLPAVLIEAGLTGLPVVATDIGAVREVILHEETGIVVPPEDPAALATAVQAALRDGAGLAANLRQHCLDHFEINVVARTWDAMLEQLSKEHGP